LAAFAAICRLWDRPFLGFRPGIRTVHRQPAGFGGRMVLATSAVSRRMDFARVWGQAYRSAGSGPPTYERLKAGLRSWNRGFSSRAAGRTRDEMAARARALWETERRASDRDLEFWLQARPTTDVLPAAR